MSGTIDRRAALQASLAKQNTVGMHVGAWVNQTVVPYLANNAAVAETALRVGATRRVTGVRRVISQRPSMWLLGAACLGLALAILPSRR